MLILQGTANTIYPQAIRHTLANGAVVTSRNGETREVRGAHFIVENPAQGLVTAVGRPVNVAFALAEVLWILAGRNDVEMLAHYNSRISDYSDDGRTFNAAYGHRLRHTFWYDQLEEAIRTLKADPDSRQAVLNIWSPHDDRGWSPNMKGLGDQDPDEPWRSKLIVEKPEEGYKPRRTKDRACNVVSMLLVRDGALHWTQIMRSNDACWGTPYNWVQWTHIMQYVAMRLGVELGEYQHVAQSFHIYEHHYEEAAGIAPFDLYQYASAPRLGPNFDIDAMLAMEEKTRNGETILWGDLVEDPLCWSMVTLFMAHTLWKSGMNDAAIEVLMANPGVFELAQLRFYYSARWSKPGHEFTRLHLGDMMEKHGLPREVMAWITNTEFALEA